jgi:hypothetical protein
MKLIEKCLNVPLKLIIWCLDNIGLIMTAAGTGLFVYIVVAALRNDAVVKESFFKECLADGNKQYECMAMWRGGASKDK